MAHVVLMLGGFIRLAGNSDKYRDGANGVDNGEERDKRCCNINHTLTPFSENPTVDTP